MNWTLESGLDRQRIWEGYALEISYWPEGFFAGTAADYLAYTTAACGNDPQSNQRPQKHVFLIGNSPTLQSQSTVSDRSNGNQHKYAFKRHIHSLLSHVPARIKLCNKNNCKALYILTNKCNNFSKAISKLGGTLFMSLIVSFLRASHGDAILIRTGVDSTKPFRILIDGGPSECFQKKQGPKIIRGPLQELLSSLVDRGEKLDLVVMTHVDDDHIGGLLKAFQSDTYQKVLGSNVWFNSAYLISKELAESVSNEADIRIKLSNGLETSIVQGIIFDDQLSRMGISDRSLKITGQKIPFDWGAITILSPNEDQLRALAKKWEHEESNLLTSGAATDYSYSIETLQENDSFEEDKSIHNGSSIAFLIESGNSKALFLGDAQASAICTSLRKLGYSENNPLKIGLCKLAHHGSKANTSSEFLSLVECEKFIVSTNGLRHGLPNKKTIARILAASPHSSILFNYPKLKEKIFSADELKELAACIKDIDGDISL
jgi:beta-lactamase superfamily II metal-dependent hydrolase